jgi:alkanesulfonate monooxygenase SsuD/methylene tetrahydromethanopterin reductase-like flavin-dependent oxidoreductase (luciferase family)
MTVSLGMFSMPFHLQEDHDAIVLAEQLGFTEAFVGAHTSSGSERITSPLIFLAGLLRSTSRIRLGTGVINVPQGHPATIAADAAMFDHMSGGRLILGIGPGSLASDVELFGIPQADRRAEMLLVPATHSSC